MNSLSKLGLASLALVLCAGNARSQGEPAWNRRISDVRIVHPPGTPPGTWRIGGTLIIGDASAPVGADLGCEMTLYLNGTPIETVIEPVSPQSDVNGCTCADAPCVIMHTAYGSIGGRCMAGFSYGCGCGTIILLDPPTWSSYVLQPSDVLEIEVAASAGSLPEIDMSDDSFSITVGEHVVGTPYCSGDGTLSTACPCGNHGAPGHGCASSVNPEGALLGATGFTEVDPGSGTDAVVLHGSGMPGTSTCIYLKGATTNANGAIYGDGVRCASGPYVRLRTKINVGGASKFPEPGDPSLSVRGGTPSGSGMTGYYQVYYRNPPNFCTPATFNISNAVSVVW